MPVELLESERDWFPYLSVKDDYKLNDVREALRAGDLVLNSKLGKVHRLTPLAL